MCLAYKGGLEIFLESTDDAKPFVEYARTMFRVRAFNK